MDIRNSSGYVFFFFIKHKYCNVSITAWVAISAKKDDATLGSNFPTAQKSAEISDTAFV